MADPHVPLEDSPDLELTDGGSADSASHPLLSSQEVAIDNTNAAGGTSQTVTVTNRGKNGGTFTIVVVAASSVKISGRGVRSYAFGSTDANVLWRVGPRGSVFGLVGPFASAGGAGTAATVTHNFAGLAVTPSADGTFQMGGLGSSLKITPIKSGIVLVIISLAANPGVSGDTVQAKISFGTGAAPALHDAQTGTVSQLLQYAVATVAAGISETLITQLSLVISGLTLNTQYWFDVSVEVASHVNDAVTVYNSSVQELGT